MTRSTSTATKPAATPFRRAGEQTVPLRDPFFRDLVEDWDRLGSMTSTWTRLLKRWARTQPSLIGISGPDEILYRIDHGTVADKDAILLALVTLTQQGQQLAGRVVLQAMLPKLCRMLNRTRPRGDDWAKQLDDQRHTAIAVFWEILATYPVQRRPERVAANLALDTLHELTKPARRPVVEFPVTDDELGRHPQPTSDPDEGPGTLHPDCDLLEVVAWAVDMTAISPDEARLLVTVYVPEKGRLDYAAAAQDLGLSLTALRQRCSRARRRLIDAVRADAHGIQTTVGVGPNANVTA